jgi:hypothetical protein
MSPFAFGQRQLEPQSDVRKKAKSTRRFDQVRRADA